MQMSRREPRAESRRAGRFSGVKAALSVSRDADTRFSARALAFIRTKDRAAAIHVYTHTYVHTYTHNTRMPRWLPDEIKVETEFCSGGL